MPVLPPKAQDDEVSDESRLRSRIGPFARPQATHESVLASMGLHSAQGYTTAPRKRIQVSVWRGPFLSNTCCQVLAVGAWRSWLGVGHGGFRWRPCRKKKPAKGSAPISLTRLGTAARRPPGCRNGRGPEHRAPGPGSGLHSGGLQLLQLRNRTQPSAEAASPNRSCPGCPDAKWPRSGFVRQPKDVRAGTRGPSKKRRSIQRATYRAW